MDIQDTLRIFATDLAIENYDVTKTTSEIEKLYPEIMNIVQKNEEFFNKSFMLFQRPISELNHDAVWKHLPVCMFASFTNGNFSDKLETLLGIAKNFLSANPSEGTDEISKILNDESAQSSIQEFMDYCTNTRIAKVLNEILTNLDVSEYEHLLSKPHEFIEIARNPDHPMVKKFIQKLQNSLKSKIERGEITQHQLTQDIEGIKSKLTGMFGSAITNALGGTRSDVPATTLISNSPEARHQRMLARLQRKHREKTQH